ncbi:MAG: MmgE/PrpD family protein [Hyphomicrobiales bacterium]
MTHDISITESIIQLTNMKHIPVESIAVMRLSMLDWLGVALAGKDEPVSRNIRKFALSEAGASQASLIGTRHKLPARAAALVNGTTSHALDYDDTHFAHIGHPSVAILPAAFAIAEMIGASRQSTLEAALIGCEASCRIGMWLGRDHYQHGFHQTASAGTFGATIAASRLLGLSHATIQHALGLASTRASGLKSQFGTMGKPFHAGMAASNGVEAALLAKGGFISQVDGLEGPQGFGPTHAGENKSFDEPRNSFVFDSIQHKFHACCHGTHATLEALDALAAQHTIDLNKIANIEITVHSRWLTVCDIKKPTTGLEAKFSYCVTAAAKLAGYNTGALDTFSDELCSMPEILKIAEKVMVKTDDTLPETAAGVSIQLNSGENLRRDHDLDQLLDYKVREEKIMNKVGALIGFEKMQRIWELLNRPASYDHPFNLEILLGA